MNLFRSRNVKFRRIRIYYQLQKTKRVIISYDLQTGGVILHQTLSVIGVHYQQYDATCL